MIARAMFAIEDIDIVYPNVGVVCVEWYPIVHATHNAEVAELYALWVAAKESEALYGSIIANAFKGHIQLAVGPSALNLNSFFWTSKLVNIRSFNCTNKAEGNWGSVISFLVAGNNALQTCALSSAALGIGDYGGGNGLGAICCNI